MLSPAARRVQISIAISSGRSTAYRLAWTTSTSSGRMERHVERATGGCNSGNNQAHPVVAAKSTEGDHHKSMPSGVRTVVPMWISLVVAWLGVKRRRPIGGSRC